jgi:hypothetical protein
MYSHPRPRDRVTLVVALPRRFEGGDVVVRRGGPCSKGGLRLDVHIGWWVICGRALMGGEGEVWASGNREMRW